MAVLSIMAVVARFHVRYSKKAGLKSDDWLIVMSLLALIATDILAILGSCLAPIAVSQRLSTTHSKDKKI